MRPGMSQKMADPDQRRNKLLLYSVIVLCVKSKRNRQKWTKGWYQQRHILSHSNLMKELLFEPNDWQNYMRMSEEAFRSLLLLITPYIEKKDTVMRQAIPPNERLSATLRFLATGMTYEELKFPTAISSQSLGEIIPETCKAILTVLRDYLKMPDTEEKWKKIAKDFELRWQFPHCLGAIDGKHVKIVPPRDSGSFYWNYKHFHSVVLMACADANYKIIWCEVGVNGRISDGGAIRATEFYDKLCSKNLSIPCAETLPGTEKILPYVFVGDEAFAMRADLLKPYSQKSLSPDKRVYNYRLSRARRIIENVFGIMSNRFKILQTAINLSIEKIDLVVLTICALHNFLRCESARYCTSEDESLDDFYDELTPLQLQSHDHNPSSDAKLIRETFKEYFNDEGAVDWQGNYVGL